METALEIVFELPRTGLKGGGSSSVKINSLRWRAVFNNHGLRHFSPAPPNASCTPAGRAPARFKNLKQKLLARLTDEGDDTDLAWKDFDLRGYTDFQLRVWKALHAIPFGRTTTYAQLAAQAGSPKGYRACGQACGANPILIFIPCHRVVSSTGLGGFSGGLALKKSLLALEKISVKN